MERRPRLSQHSKVSKDSLKSMASTPSLPGSVLANAKQNAGDGTKTQSGLRQAPLNGSGAAFRESFIRRRRVIAERLTSPFN